MPDSSPRYAVLMVTHDTLRMTRLATLRTLRHSAAPDARLVVVDNASTDGTREWLALLADRGDLTLVRSDVNLGHGPALQRALQATDAPFVVTLDSDAFPLADDWLPRLEARLRGSVKVAGIRHHRGYIHPACLMIARETLEALGLHFLNEKDRPSRLDVAERLSREVERHGFQLAGLERTGARRRGSPSEPVDLGASYEGIVYHQWYTTRSVRAGGGPVDDVPPEAVEAALRELFDEDAAEPRDVTVVMGVRADPHDPRRRRNAEAALRALNLQHLPRWRYRVVVVEQGEAPRLEPALRPFADAYRFAYNPGPYNRGWGFNVGAAAAWGHGALCLIDADLLVPRDFLSRGLAALHEGAAALLPYTDVRYLDDAASERAIGDWQAGPPVEVDITAYRGESFSGSQGGCIWVDAARYDSIGGHDERYRGWGAEDRAFYRRISAHGEVRRLPGGLLHLHHAPAPRADEAARANQHLLRHTNGTADGPPAVVGDVRRYEGAEEAPIGRRVHERWHRWSPERIEGVVRRERGLDPDASARRRLADLVVRLGDTLLDVGCGPGAMWTHFEPHRPRVSWTGADVTPEMLDVARRLFTHVEVVHAEARALPFLDDAFDVVLLRHVLEHLPVEMLPEVLREAFRVARRAVVADFYVPPAESGPPQTAHVDGGFLETRWTAEALAAAETDAPWGLAHRFTLDRQSPERDEVWIWTPRSGRRGEPVRLPLAVLPGVPAEGAR